MVDHRVAQGLDYLRRRKVDFADIRMVRQDYHGFLLSDGTLEFNAFGMMETPGIGVRVRVRNGWGFAAGGAGEGVADEALRVARVSAKANEQQRAYVRRAGTSVPKGDFGYRTRVERDPFAMERKTIIDTMREIDDLLAQEGVDHREVILEFDRARKDYANTEDLGVTQEFQYASAHIAVSARHNGELLQRTYEGQCLVAQGGWERIEEWDLRANARRIVEELRELKNAPPCPSGVMDAVLHPSQVYLQTHENGHGFELDRMLGYEIGFAGGSFLRPSDAGVLRYGSQKVNIKADADYPDAAGSFGWDDDGTPGQEIYLVREGIVQNFLSSRETAHMAKGLPRHLRKSTGAMRGESDDYPPLIRMTNVYLEPGNDGTIEDLISATERGILMRTNRTWSIDNWRRNFHFATEMGWMIENGKITHAVRGPNYQDETQRFWGAVDMVGSHATLLGVANCGKGQPGQSMLCGHPSPPIRVRDLRVGVGAGGSAGGCTHVNRHHRVSSRSKTYGR